MKWNHLIKRFRFYLQYFPLTLNFFIVGAALWVCWHFLKRADPDKKKNDTLDSFEPLIVMMGKIALYFVAGLILLSILTAIACWVYYLWIRKKKKYLLELSFENTKSVGGMWFEAILKTVRRPLLGFIKGRLFFDNYDMTDKFILASNKRKAGSFWREGVAGKSLLQFPDIKEFDVGGGFVYFQDMLQLISLPVRQKITNHFYQPPVNLETEEQDVSPLKTEDTDVRIEQLRRVDGDYINYKDFESGDDVRRIVWKVYAKNRDLVVRIPEIFNPYASQVYFFASFHSTINSLLRENVFAQSMLNYYKNFVWTVYEGLSKKDFEVKFIPDEELHIPDQESMDAYVQRVISNSNWQNDHSLSEYFKPKYGSVLIVSSMNNPKEIAEALEQCNKDTLVYFVKLSDCFKNANPLSLLWRVLIKPPDDRYKRVRSRWFFSPFRLQLQKREIEIEKALQQSDASVGAL